MSAVSSTQGILCENKRCVLKQMEVPMSHFCELIKPKNRKQKRGNRTGKKGHLISICFKQENEFDYNNYLY